MTYTRSMIGLSDSRLETVEPPETGKIGGFTQSDSAAVSRYTERHAERDLRAQGWTRSQALRDAKNLLIWSAHDATQ